MKNWTVISKPVKEQFNGLCRYLTYLTSSTHKNHDGKTTIIPIVGNALSIQKNINNSVIQRDYLRSKARKGGRKISSYAQSYVMTLPRTIEPKPDSEDWKNISKELIKTIASYTTDGNISELKNNIFINLHNQENPHLNIVVLKVINGKVVKELQQKSIINALKKSFNYAVLKQLGLSPADYTPKTKRKKRYNSDYYSTNSDVINAMSTNPDFYVKKSNVQKEVKKNNREIGYE